MNITALFTALKLSKTHTNLNRLMSVSNSCNSSQGGRLSSAGSASRPNTSSQYLMFDDVSIEFSINQDLTLEQYKSLLPRINTRLSQLKSEIGINEPSPDSAASYFHENSVATYCEFVNGIFTHATKFDDVDILKTVVDDCFVKVAPFTTTEVNAFVNNSFRRRSANVEKFLILEYPKILGLLPDFAYIAGMINAAICSSRLAEARQIMDIVVASDWCSSIASHMDDLLSTYYERVSNRDHIITLINIYFEMCGRYVTLKSTAHTIAIKDNMPMYIILKQRCDAIGVRIQSPNIYNIIKHSEVASEVLRGNCFVDYSAYFDPNGNELSECDGNVNDPNYINACEIMGKLSKIKVPYHLTRRRNQVIARLSVYLHIDMINLIVQYYGW